MTAEIQDYVTLMQNIQTNDIHHIKMLLYAKDKKYDIFKMVEHATLDYGIDENSCIAYTALSRWYSAGIEYEWYPFQIITMLFDYHGIENLRHEDISFVFTMYQEGNEKYVRLVNLLLKRYGVKFTKLLMSI